MPYTKSPRPYKHEYQLQKKRAELPARMERQKARRELDKEGINRKGKDIEHIHPLSKGGTNAKSNIRLETPHDNRSFHRNPDGSVKKNVPYPKRKK